jgi:hypothetical protein
VLTIGSKTITRSSHTHTHREREIACYDVEKEAYDPQFWTFFLANWFRSVYQSKKMPTVNMQWTDWDFIQKEEQLPAFAEVIATCEHHVIKDVMELKYDWNY